MTDKKMSILYTIKGIRPYGPLDGFVAILLSPVDKIQNPKTRSRTRKDGNMQLGMCGPDGPIPEEVMEQMQEIFGEMVGMRKPDHNKDRDIVLIESEMVFQKRGWHYGNTITATFEKLDE
jgi:hypothetical protein